MAVNEVLLNRVREGLVNMSVVEEKKMFGGVCFMVDDKMCVCVRRTNIMCRLDPDTYHDELEKNGVEQMIHNGREMKGYVFVNELAINTDKELQYWLDATLAYNKIALSSKKKK